MPSEFCKRYSAVTYYNSADVNRSLTVTFIYLHLVSRAQYGVARQYCSIVESYSTIDSRDRSRWRFTAVTESEH